ncbi:glycerol dehydrogenase [Algihabitans albus]|uniref:glycerol dehydrogenase n=1 Tax=Algihabitans albus TaxID=2164067 RepID=UPI000E5C6CA5|nr:glycerol dehydrogenase [Algihabitans albus]
MTVRIFGFPGRYLQGPGALEHLGETAADLGGGDAVLIADPVVAGAAARAERSLQDAALRVIRLASPTECTPAAAESLKAQAESADLVVGFGGGKTIDLSKAVARALDSRLIIAPSIASNDSPTSRLIVFYDETHRVSHVEQLRRNPDAVLVDTDVIVAAPKRFLAAGIGDAFSKRYEVGQAIAAGGRNFFGTPSLHTARILAVAAHEILLQNAAGAMAAVGRQEITDELELVVEAAVLLSGLAFESGGLSIAHALLRGLTALPQCRNALHGEMVAYGTLVQMAAEGRDADELARIGGFLSDISLPVSLQALADREIKRADREKVAELTLAAPYIGNFNLPLDADAILSAMDIADECTRPR